MQKLWLQTENMSKRAHAHQEQRRSPLGLEMSICNRFFNANYDRSDCFINTSTTKVLSGLPATANQPQLKI